MSGRLAQLCAATDDFGFYLVCHTEGKDRTIVPREICSCLPSNNTRCFGWHLSLPFGGCRKGRFWIRDFMLPHCSEIFVMPFVFNHICCLLTHLLCDFCWVILDLNVKHIVYGPRVIFNKSASNKSWMSLHLESADNPLHSLTVHQQASRWLCLCHAS